MIKIACIKHRTYSGKSAPDLSCKTCCHIYVENLKVQAGVGQPNGFDSYKWVTSKTRAAITPSSIEKRT